MFTKIIVSARRDLVDNSIQNDPPKPLTVKIALVSSDRRRPRSTSSQCTRSASPTSSATNVPESGNLMITLKSTCVTTSTSTTLDSNTATDNSTVKTPQPRPVSKANTRANLSLLEKRMRIGRKTKLGHSRYTSAAHKFKTPAGNVINLQHEKYALTYGMMCGIRDSAGLQKPFKQRLTMDDFMLVNKRIFPANAQLRHPFKFKDYSPDVFCQVRRHFGIDLADYLLTLSGDFNFIEFMSNSKSGQFFFYSHDGRFMIKTQTKDESKFLRRILPQYYKFVLENPNTLLTRFYGMHRVKMHHLRRKMHFVIMASVFDTPLEIQARYDLKGSSIGRHASAKDHERGSPVVYKDNDLLDKGFHVQLGASQRAIFLDQLRKDVDFLKRMKIMDYSLLVGVHDSGRELRGDLYSNILVSDRSSSVASDGGCTSLPASPAGSDSVFVNLPQRRPLRSASVPVDGIPMRPSLMQSAIVNMQTRLALSPRNSPTWSNDFADLNVNTDSDYELDDCTSSDSGFGHSFGAAFEEFSSPSKHRLIGSLPSTPRSPSIMSPLSPRLLDTTSYPEYSKSIFCKDDGGICGRDQHGHKNGFVYFLGIIDILQQYNTRKIAETFFKGLRHNRKHISAVAPEFYGDRFIEYMESHVVRDDTLTQLPLSPSSVLNDDPICFDEDTC